MRRLFMSVPLLALVACAPPKKATPYPDKEPPGGTVQPEQREDEPDEAGSGTATYFERNIELEPFLVGFPYRWFQPSLRTSKLFFLETGDTYTLKMLDIPDGVGKLALDSAEAISDVDWSQRSLWSMHHPEGSDTIWLHADARNDEKMNLWTLNVGNGRLDQVTKHDYVYGYGFNEAESLIAYLPRKGTKAPYRTCLHVLDVETREDRKIICDTNALRFTWSSLRFSPDDKEVFFNAQIDGDRNRVQLVRVNVQAKRHRVRSVTDRKVERNSPSALDGWVDDDLLLFTANDDGFRNLYSFSRATGKVRQLTHFREDLVSAELSERGVVGVHRTPAGSTLVVVDPKTGAVRSTVSLPGRAEVEAAHGNRAFYRQQSPGIRFEAYIVDLTSKNHKGELAIALDEELEEAIVECRARAVEIPTFDTDAATGNKRLLHAFVMEPKQALGEGKQRLGLIRAFYGGANTYDTFDQVMCAAGLVIVSPSVRGSSGFGKSFHSLNDRDLGGDEIVDLFHVARWMEKQLDLPSRRIGVYGRSHGGYATMRALTFPPKTNGRNDLYPFGFGLADAGFSDIKAFYDATNIPDWVVLESGDPNKPKDLAKMNDRSPINHVDKLRAPILIIHGSNDWRVPVQGSRDFVEKARALERSVTYVEFEGQGHAIKGLGLQVQAYQARFDFLMAVANAAPEQ